MPVYSPITLESKEAVHFFIQTITPDSIVVRIELNVSDPKQIPDLDDYLLDGSSLFVGPSPAELIRFLNEYPANENGLISIQDDGIPKFIEQIRGEWARFTSGDIETLLHTHPVQKKAKFILVATNQIVNGVGLAIALPKVSVNGVLMDAAEISRKLKPGIQYVNTDAGWIPADNLRQIGIGPMGRAVNGVALDKGTLLKPEEILERGGPRMEGPWSKLEFSDLVWPIRTDNLILGYLQFLTRWGLSGGVKGGAASWMASLVDYLQELTREYPSVRVLLVGSKNQIDVMRKNHYEQISFTWLTSSSEVSRYKLSDTFCLGVTPSVLGKQEDLRSLKYDVLVMMEPDAMTKSTETQTYSVLSQIKARIRLSLFSEAGYLDQPNVKWTHLCLLKLQSTTEQNWVILNPDNPHKKLPNPYRMKVNSSKRATPDDILFTEFNMDDENGSTPGGISTGNDTSAGIKIDYVTRELLFTRQAKSFVDRIEKLASAVPFMAYRPTYNDMTASQQKWYFFWRGEVRSNRYPDTDLTYIFIFIYEIINGVGWTKPELGLDQLIKLLRHYGGTHRQLQNYLIDWICDFALLHSLQLHVSDIAPDPFMLELLPVVILDKELLEKFQESPIKIPINLLLTLSNYDLKKSRFFQSEGRVDLEHYVPRVFAVVDAYVTKTYSTRLVQMFSPGENLQTVRHLFGGAVYDSTSSKETLTIYHLPLRNHVPLREFVTQLIRYTENKLRIIKGYKSRLKEIKFDSEIELLIDRYLSREFSQQTAKPVINIDKNRLAQLLEETEYVREMLTIEEDSLVEEPIGISQAGALDEGSERDNISAAAKDPTVKLSKEWLRNAEVLGDEWLQLASSFTEVHFEALAALMSDSPTELKKLAEDNGTMPSLLIDEINQAAMEYVGDLILSEEGIVEDYLEFIKVMRGEGI